MKPGTVAASIFLGLFAFLMLFALPPLGALLLLLAICLFTYGLVTSPPTPPVPPVPPVPAVLYTPATMTLCPQSKTPVTVDTDYCPKCGAYIRSRMREIVKEKEVIIKIRCSYCGTPYDETLDRCSHCGAKH